MRRSGDNDTGVSMSVAAVKELAIAIDALRRDVKRIEAIVDAYPKNLPAVTVDAMPILRAIDDQERETKELIKRGRQDSMIIVTCIFVAGILDKRAAVLMAGAILAWMVYRELMMAGR